MNSFGNNNNDNVDDDDYNNLPWLLQKINYHPACGSYLSAIFSLQNMTSTIYLLFLLFCLLLLELFISFPTSLHIMNVSKSSPEICASV